MDKRKIIANDRYIHKSSILIDCSQSCYMILTNPPPFSVSNFNRSIYFVKKKRGKIFDWINNPQWNNFSPKNFSRTNGTNGSEVKEESGRNAKYTFEKKTLSYCTKKGEKREKEVYRAGR